MVLAIILFIAAVSGAHLNPVVSLAFAVGGDFRGRRVPGYIIVQLLGATLACLFLLAVFGKVEDHVDFTAGLIRVRRGWDDIEGPIEPKTFAGARDVPMMGELRRICLAHKLGTGRNDEQLFLGRSLVDPFYPSTVGARAHKAWKAAKLEPLTPHEARHCAASYMIACGLDWKKISEFLGHTDVRTTFNRYGKVVDEDLSDAAARLDAYFDRHRDSSQAGNLLGNLVNGLERFPAVPSGPRDQ